MKLQKPISDFCIVDRGDFITAHQAEYDAAMVDPTLQPALQNKFQAWTIAKETQLKALNAEIGKVNWEAFKNDPQAVLTELAELGGRSSEPGEIAVYYRLATIQKLSWGKAAGSKLPKGCDYGGKVSSKGFNVTFQLGNGEVIKAAGSAYYDRNDQSRAACSLIYQHLRKLAEKAEKKA